jgi:hypothetical protein
VNDTKKVFLTSENICRKETRLSEQDLSIFSMCGVFFSLVKSKKKCVCDLDLKKKKQSTQVMNRDFNVVFLIALWSCGSDTSLWFCEGQIESK